MDSKENKDKNEEEEVKETAVSDSISVQTFSMLPPEATSSEKFNEMYAMIEKLCHEFGDPDESRESYDELHNDFEKLKSTISELTNKLNCEITYTQNLEERIQRKKAELENVHLKKTLLEERKIIASVCDDLKKEMAGSMDCIYRSFNAIQGVIEDKIQVLEEKASKIVELKDQIEELLIESNREIQKAAYDQYVLLKSNCEDALKTNMKQVGEIKEKVLQFLSCCRKENQDLIKKVPEQKKKFTIKDGFIYALCVLCVVEMITQIVMMWGK